ncbi:MAG: class I SAM-dependent methyltransferase [Leptospirales bacterium]|nr:class I SAM-dependent methyltransferase [Leptospirales bacterium]HNE24034.1 class I SAM-dependent methyltransferase [Leptospiraceae bacterium]HNL02243.1 class I SAM-dependent methyltransferase [Leptospiraceae bacterium]
MKSEKKFQHKSSYYNDIALRLMQRLFHVEHLHYGYFEGKLKPEIKNLPAAQEAYMKLLLKQIPSGVKKIFDVGCGTGEVAAALTKKGYQMTCIAPDPYLVSMTEKKTGGKAVTFVDLYENIDTEVEHGTFDLILMSESCQYIKPDPGWINHVRFLKPGGYILVADFFKAKPPDERNPSKSGQPLDDFLRRADENGFKIVKKQDITKNVAPTMDIYQRIILDRIFPVVEAVFEIVERKAPTIYKILRYFLSAKILKLKDKYEKTGADLFSEYKRYMIFLLQKKK